MLQIFSQSIICGGREVTKCGAFNYQLVLDYIQKVSWPPPICATMLQNVPKLHQLELYVIADQVARIPGDKMIGSQEQLISLLVTTIGVLVCYTGTVVLHRYDTQDHDMVCAKAEMYWPHGSFSFVELHSSDHCELQKVPEDFQSSAKLKIFQSRFSGDIIATTAYSHRIRFFRSRQGSCDLQPRLEGKPHFKRWGVSW
jgi:hypothetical protein